MKSERRSWQGNRRSVGAISAKRQAINSPTDESREASYSWSTPSSKIQFLARAALESRSFTTAIVASGLFATGARHGRPPGAAMISTIVDEFPSKPAAIAAVVRCARRGAAHGGSYSRSHHQRQHETFDSHAFKSNRRNECVQMPGKMARSDPRSSVRATQGTGSGQHLPSLL